MMGSSFIKVFFLLVSRKQVSTNGNFSSLMQRLEQVVIGQLQIMEGTEIRCKEGR